MGEKTVDCCLQKEGAIHHSALVRVGAVSPLGDAWSALLVPHRLEPERALWG